MGESKSWPVYKKVIYQFGMLALFFQGTRLLFFLINQHYFPQVGVSRYCQLIGHSLRFDLSTIFSINLLYLVLALLPFEFVAKYWYQRILSFIFISVNSIAILFDLADIGYFPYVRKRMSADVFHLIGRKSDFIDLLPSYIKTFWFVPIAAIVFVMFLMMINRKVIQKFHSNYQVFSIKSILLYLLTLSISLIVIRGGLQLKPILNINALLVASNQEAPLVLNTPFSILHTFEQNKLERYSLSNEENIEAWYHPIKQGYNQQNSEKNNVVVIILESFGKQYTGIGGRESDTPFLDSLMQRGFVFSNAYANGHRSADGIPACIAGIPTFMDEAFTTSPYSENILDALPSLLRKTGYSSSFFHGGTNGTMSFDIFAKSAGYNHYFGRTEYQHDQDYDGTWGIWDEPFLQYMATQLGTQKQPFFSTVFTLSSHEPFKLPSQYKNASFAKKVGIKKGISYSDLALRKFFETASKQAWYKNTLFVLTADHNFLANTDSLGYYNNGMGLYSIPIVLFQPSDNLLHGSSNVNMQQIDILPTVLQYLHYPYSYFSFGQSGFDTISKRNVYNQMGDHTQFLRDSFLLVTDNISDFKVYNFKQDSLMKMPLDNDSIRGSLHQYFVGFKQLLTNSIIDNRQSFSTYNGKK